MIETGGKVQIAGEAAADRACSEPSYDSVAAPRSTSTEPLPLRAYAPHGLAEGIAALAGEALFAMILAEAGPPRFRRRRNGFGTLLHIILEQQVSIDAAAAMHRRLSEACRPLTPERFLALDEATLRACGFSRQKAGYGRDLAAKLAVGDFDFDELASADDAGAQAALVALKGIGRWSADVYMLFALGRADIWPAADLGLQVGIEERLGLAARPNEAEVLRLGEAWRPWRSVAACLFWQAYLHKRRRSPPILSAELYA
jgi:DNA-3-methyladenine glycosylase II